jgi:Phosphotransferase System HPr (HPr) Family
MKNFTYTIKDAKGLHARPAGLLAKEAKRFNSKIIITANGKTADLKHIFAVMSLGIKFATTLTITIDGEDEDVAELTLEKYIKTNL